MWTMLTIAATTNAMSYSSAAASSSSSSSSTSSSANSSSSKQRQRPLSTLETNSPTSECCYHTKHSKQHNDHTSDTNRPAKRSRHNRNAKQPATTTTTTSREHVAAGVTEFFLSPMQGIFKSRAFSATTKPHQQQHQQQLKIKHKSHKRTTQPTCTRMALSQVCCELAKSTEATTTSQQKQQQQQPQTSTVNRGDRKGDLTLLKRQRARCDLSSLFVSNTTATCDCASVDVLTLGQRLFSSSSFASLLSASSSASSLVEVSSSASASLVESTAPRVSAQQQQQSETLALSTCSTCISIVPSQAPSTRPCTCAECQRRLQTHRPGVFMSSTPMMQRTSQPRKVHKKRQAQEVQQANVRNVRRRLADVSTSTRLSAVNLMQSSKASGSKRSLLAAEAKKKLRRKLPLRTSSKRDLTTAVNNGEKMLVVKARQSARATTRTSQEHMLAGASDVNMLSRCNTNNNNENFLNFGDFVVWYV